MHPALFYRPGDRLSLPELGAARLDGLVVELGEGYMPADTVEGADARALGIADLIPANTAACGPTAAWIHGAGDSPPVVHHVRRTTSARLRTAPSVRVIHHERCARPSELMELSGVAVMTPEATASELLYSAVLRTGGSDWLRALLLTAPELMAVLDDELAHTARRPGRRLAADLLARIRRDQEVETR